MNNYINYNSGYIGASRSVRSQEAIKSYEVPLSWICTLRIESFLAEIEPDVDEEDLSFLKKQSENVWKYLAKEKVGATSWHHTGKYYAKTDHYDMRYIAREILESRDSLEADYKKYIKDKKKASLSINYGVIKVQVWSASRRRRRLIGYDEVAGIVVGDWIYFKDNHVIDGKISKYKINANKVEWIDEFATYKELVMKHKKYKASKCVFNRIAKEKGIKL